MISETILLVVWGILFVGGIAFQYYREWDRPHFPAHRGGYGGLRSKRLSVRIVNSEGEEEIPSAPPPYSEQDDFDERTPLLTAQPRDGALGTNQPRGGALGTPQPRDGALGTPQPRGGALGTPQPLGGALGTPQPRGVGIEGSRPVPQYQTADHWPPQQELQSHSSNTGTL